MKKFNISILIFISLFLAGCFGSPTSVPEDRFYKLKVSKPEVVATKYKRIVIKKVHAHGLYNERAMLYVNSELPLQIKRYHYHHWIMSPIQLIKHSLKVYISQSHIAEEVIEQGLSSGGDMRLSVQLLAFERVIQTGSQLVHIEMEFEITHPNGQHKTYLYSQNIKTQRNTLHSTAIAYGEALRRIYSQLLARL